MPANRPSIPADIEREIFIEAGHRCAICGTSFPLERAHIVAWNKSKTHRKEDLICLCANCHEMADLGKWPEATLREYKKRPWVARYNKAEASPSPKTKITVSIDMEIENFDEKQKRWFKHGLADYLDIPVDDVRITSEEEGSVKCTIELPEKSAEKLLAAFERKDPELFANLDPIIILDVRRKERLYVGTLVGESTSQSFRLAVAHETIREQDFIAVDSIMRQPSDGHATPKELRIWAKVQRIERINPLFPAEAGHELAATKTDPFDTVLSFSREMVTAVCQILGAEPLSNGFKGKLEHVRYPPQPATSAYRPDSDDIARIILGSLQEQQGRALDIATLSNRPEVSVKVDGHAIVSRHLAILAMTGAGKSWTARRIIEELAAKEYPIVIFDPHGDYTGLADVPELQKNVRRYYAQFPLFEEDSETVAEIVNALGYPLTDTMRTRFGDVFNAASAFLRAETGELQQRTSWLAQLTNSPDLLLYKVEADMWLVARMAEAGEIALRDDNQEAKQRLKDWGWDGILNYSRTDLRTLEGIKKRTFRAAAVLRRMERTNREISRSAIPLPTDRKELVRYGGISIISLAGYTSDFQATIYSIIADNIFEARVNGDLKLPVMLLLEEAHNFVPGKANTPAEQRAINTTKQIAQEGRKFGVGLILVSQRPSRLDETTLSQCNSYIIMRMVNPADQNFVRKVVESLSEDEARMLPGLDVGEAILSGQLINFPILVKIKQPKSSGEHEEKDAFELLKSAWSEINNSSGRG